MTFNNSSLYLSQMHFPARAKTIKIFTDRRIFHSFAFSTLTVVTFVATLLTLRQPSLTLLTNLLDYGDILHHHPDPHHLPNIAAVDCTLLCLITFNYFYQYNDFFSMVLTAVSGVPCPETEGELRIEIIISCCGRR